MEIKKSYGVHGSATDFGDFQPVNLDKADTIKYIEENLYKMHEVYEERKRIMRFLQMEEEKALMKEKPDINKNTQRIIDEMGNPVPIHKRALKLHEQKMKAREETMKKT